MKSIPYTTRTLAIAKRRKSLSAISGRFTSLRLVVCFTTPYKKNRTSSANPIACNDPWILCMMLQIVPPRKVSGSWVSRFQISPSLSAHVRRAFSKLSNTPSNEYHLLQIRKASIMDASLGSFNPQEHCRSLHTLRALYSSEHSSLGNAGHYLRRSSGHTDIRHRSKGKCLQNGSSGSIR